MSQMAKCLAISLNYCYSLKVMSISTVSLQQHQYLHRQCSYVDSWISGLKCEANHILKVVLKKINKTKNKLDEEKNQDTQISQPQ